MIGYVTPCVISQDVYKIFRICFLDHFTSACKISSNLHNFYGNHNKLSKMAHHAGTAITIQKKVNEIKPLLICTFVPYIKLHFL